jgi:hypothetical protein
MQHLAGMHARQIVESFALLFPRGAVLAGVRFVGTVLLPSGVRAGIVPAAGDGIKSFLRGAGRGPRGNGVPAKGIDTPFAHDVSCIFSVIF